MFTGIDYKVYPLCDLVDGPLGNGCFHPRTRNVIQPEFGTQPKVRYASGSELVFWLRFNSSARRMASATSFIVFRRLRACFLMME